MTQLWRSLCLPPVVNGREAGYVLVRKGHFIKKPYGPTSPILNPGCYNNQDANMLQIIDNSKQTQVSIT